MVAEQAALLQVAKMVQPLQDLVSPGCCQKAAKVQMCQVKFQATLALLQPELMAGPVQPATRLELALLVAVEQWPQVVEPVLAALPEVVLPASSLHASGYL